MPSRSGAEFLRARDRARLLVAAAGSPPASSPPDAHKASCLHAALAMLVAAWEGYLERLVAEVQQQVTDSTNVRLSSVLALFKAITDREIKHFNTPNAENARNLLYAHTGYDPINDWQWPAGALNGPQCRQRLNEILKVRHSFAHGFAIPTDVQWARHRSTPGKLTVTVLQSVDRFLSHMVKVTDAGMSNHLSVVFGVMASW